MVQCPSKSLEAREGCSEMLKDTQQAAMLSLNGDAGSCCIVRHLAALQDLLC